MPDQEANTLKKYKILRGQCKATITRIENFVNDPIQFTSATVDILEARKEKLTCTLKEYEAVQLDILSVNENDTEQVGVIEEKYYTILAKINSSLRQLNNKVLSESHNVSTCKLPNIDIPTFDGKDFGEFKPFYDLFMAIIDNNKSLSDVQKLFYLRKYLADDALALIVNLPLINQSYKEAIHLLNKRFDNKARLVTNHISVLLDMPIIQKGTAVSIRSFVSHVQQQLHALKNFGQPVDTWDMLLIAILTRKLDAITNRAYQIDRNCEKMPSIDEFLEFLEKRAIALEDSMPHKITPSRVTNVATRGTKVTNEGKKVCKFCDKRGHALHSCPRFKTAALRSRQLFVQEHELCILCLKPHSGKCNLTFKCKICRDNHNTLLHPEQESVREPSVTLLSNPVSNNTLLPTVKVKLVNKYGQEVYVRALLDTGSQASFITTNLVKKLGLNSIIQSNNIIGIGNKPTKINEYVNITISSCHYEMNLNVKCYIVNSITTKLPQQYVNTLHWNIPKSVKLSDDNFSIPEEISLLLGADIYFNTLVEGTIKIQDGPVLQNTLFGYTVGGNICPNNCNSVTLDIVSNCAIYDHRKLENVMQHFWLSERVPEPVKPCQEFRQAEHIFQQSVTHKDNRFYVAMPFKCSLEELQLGDSFSVAYQRFLMLEKMLKRNPVLLEQYKSFIKQYIQLGHAKIVDVSSYDVYNEPVYFLAHHAVLNEASKTTKLRVVFDGSMKSKNKVSLNDMMLNGPTVQSELFDVLILFRTYLFTLICDIQKMFRQIFIHSHQKPLQNILWRDDPREPIACLQLQTVTYGLKASTFLATRCLIELATLYKDRYPLAAQAMFNNTFVDDVLTGSDSLDQLHILRNQLVELLNLGSFTLHKWCSNSPEALSDIPNEHKHFENIDMSKDKVVKTLGLMYDTMSDTFFFSCPNFNEQGHLNTKRRILAFIGKIFDPLGLIGPVVVVAKLFMQELWSLQIEWDSIVPHEKLQYWQTFVNNLKQSNKIIINRCFSQRDVYKVELVGYADASAKAYGCCLYIRQFKNDGSVQSNLICSKSRIAPLNKNLTIPQLELNAALLLSQLAHRVSKILQHRFLHKLFLYSDSQIVLAWIAATNVKSNVYVNNRVQQILVLTDQFQWFYVRTNDNPADLLSRGVEPQKLQQSVLWWHGPDYLLNANYSHKKHIITTVVGIPDMDLQDEQPIPCNVLKIESSFYKELFEKFSSVQKLQRIICFIYRFYNNCTINKNNKIKNIHFTPHELHDSMLVIVRCTQRQHFSKEIELLSCGKTLKTGLVNLNPFIDQKGILRVGGRLQNAVDIPYNKRYPIILPKHSRITDLIVEQEHFRLMHAGPRLVLSSLSQTFSIVNGIREVKKVIHKCIKCCRLRAKVAGQLMGSLPKERITASRPFQYVGIDFCGHFNMKVGRIRKPLITKAYIALFVCFAVKAIHVELVSDLSTEAFLACLSRFISRRGMPTKIFCDNAKTFKGASNTLNALYNLISSKNHRDAVINFCSQKYIQFMFIPSYSPEFGGLWEAAVKSVKYHFKRVVGDLCLTYEQFYTVIVQIEGILNSRPLVSVNVTDCEYLTPGHFLIGTAIASYPEIDLTEVSTNHLKFWKVCTKLKQDFWKSWSNDYLTLLQNRPKWKIPQSNLKEGDLFIVKNVNTSPLHWPMARIVKTFQGNDGRVRVADVKMNNKIYRRSITKLCPLPVT